MTLILSAIFALSSFAANLQMGPNGLTLDITENGQLVGKAVVSAEKWSSEEETRFVARWSAGSVMITYRSETQQFYLENGQTVNLTRISDVTARRVGGFFATGVTGRLELFAQNNGEKEAKHIVFRKNGRFYASLKLDGYANSANNLISESWEHHGNQSWKYVARFKRGTALGGQFVNSGILSKESCFFNTNVDALCPVVPVFETRQGQRNGQFLTLVYGDLERTSAGNEICRYRVPANDFGGQGGQIMTSFTPAQAESCR